MTQGICLVMVWAACGALSHAFGKKAMDDGLSTTTFLVIRSLTGAITTTIIFATSCLRLGFPQIPPSTWAFTVLVGFFHPVLSNTLYFRGLRGGDLSVMSPLINTSPFFTAILATMFLGETQPPAAVAALVLILAGAVVVPLSESHAPKGGSSTDSARRSTVLGVTSALTIAFYLVCGKQILKSAEPRFITFMLNLVAVSGFSSIALVQRVARKTCTPRKIRFRTGVLPTIISGLLVYVGCSYLMLWALQSIDASLAACLGSLNAVFGVVFGVLLLREKPSRKRCFGGLLIVIGCILSSLARR